MNEVRQVTKKQFLKAIKALEENPNDRVRILGELGITAAGLAVGSVAAAGIAGAIGVTTIPVVTTAASWLGISAVAATPVGWVLGIAAITGSAFYGISRLIRDGAMSEGRKAELLVIYRERVESIKRLEAAQQVAESEKSEFRRLLAELVQKDVIGTDRGIRLVELTESGAMSYADAYGCLQEFITIDVDYDMR